MSSALHAQQALLAHPAQREYWETLRGTWTDPVQVIRDHLRPGAGDPRSTGAPLDPAAAGALAGITSGDPVLLRTVAAAVLALLAARTTDREDVVVFLPAPPDRFGRPNRALPLAFPVRPDDPAKALLGTVRAAYLEASGHLDIEVARLLGRTDSRPTDFMVSVDGDLGPGDAEQAGTPLLFTLTTGAGAAVELRYDPVLFTEDTAGRLLETYRRLLHEVTTAPGTPLAGLLAATPDERGTIAGFNETDAPFPGDRPLHSFLEQGAREHGDRIAVTDGSGTTYAQLNTDANRLARTLRERGVAPGSIVGVCVPRSAAMLTAIYAILKAGGAYLPIDPTLPDNRIQYLLEHSGTTLVLATPETAAVLGDRPVLDVTDPAVPAADGGDLEPVAGPGDPCYVIYTSGSTGRPKGVVVEHRAIVNRLWWMQRGYPLGADDVILHKTPFTFDVSVWEIFWWSLAGAAVATLPNGDERDPARIAERIAESRATTLHFVPSMLHAFLTYTRAAGTTGRLGSLRRVFASGEALAATQVQLFHETLPDTSLTNLYGPTEAAVDVSWYDCDTLDATRSVPIGRPIDNIRLVVRTRDGRIAPPGVPGELCIAGTGLARGYLHAPELTAQRFTEGPEGYGRIYRTGDLARWLPGGVLEYLGRLDTQVKIRGYRIELGEIEHLAAGAPGVAECAVAAVAGEGAEKALCAYVVAKEGFEESVLRDTLAAELPSYMVPQFVVTVPAIPTNHNGKRDLSALPAPRSGVSAREFTEPSTDLERLLARVWSDALGVDRVGARDSFFALGGDSILAIRVVAALRQSGYEVSVGEVFAHQELADLATVVRAAAPAGPDEPAGDDTGSWPASALQQGMIYHSSLTPDIPVYHDIFRYHVEVPRVVTAELTAAWLDMTGRHPVLRASFDMEAADRPRMVVREVPEPPAEVLDLRTEPDPRAAVAAWAEAEKHRPVDPAGPEPAYRVRFFVLSDDRVVLGLSFHHALLDGWSAASLVEEWVRGYGDRLAGRETARVSAPPLQSRYAALELAAEQDPAERDFWAAELDGAQLAEVPRLAPGARGRQGAAEVVVAARPLPDELLATLRERATAWSVPLKSVFLAAHLRVQALITGQDDVTTGLVANGRPEVENAEHALGMFLNTLPYRLPLDREESWRRLAERCFGLEQRLQPHRWFPLPSVQRLHGGPVFDVLFNFTNFHVHQGSDAGAPSVVSVDYFEQTNAPLVVYVGANAYEGGWEYRIGYDPGQFSAEQIDRYLGYYLGCFHALADGGESRWAESVPLPASERAELLAPPVRPADPRLGGHTTLVDRFEAMAARYADNTAVDCGDRSLTYRELDRRANALAHRFAERGVATGDLVALALDRDLEMVVAVLATLKAGAVYVPIDPGYPEDRIRTTVEDAGVRLVVGTPEVCALFPDRATMDGTAAALDAVLGDGADRGPDHGLTAESAAYVIYTSGSTGRPKGVLVTHGNVLRLFGSTEHWFGFGADDTWSLFHSFAFDFSVWELWGALLYGGRLVVVPYWVSRSVEDFAALLIDAGVTVLSQTPSAFGQVKQALMARAGRDDIPLRHVVFGGEALDFASLADWFAHFGDERPRLVNMYGITETTVHVTYRRVTAADTRAPGSLIGEPIPDLGLHLLDVSGHPVPVGTTGELVVTGAGVARGYLGRPEESARRFVELDLGHGPVRAYRSGDLARRMPGGEVEYLGRGDAQVKIQGYRIETGDIEAALSAHPDIDSSLVVAFSRRSGGKALAGYHVPLPGRVVDPAELREHLGGLLPGYMVPGFLIGLERWPLTINGKTDRRALPDPEDHLAAAAAPYTAPRDATEARLAAVWQQVLGAPRVGIDDSYHGLGGDSLQGIRLVGAVRRAGLEVALHDLFRVQSIRELTDQGLVRAVERDPAEQDPADASRPFDLLPAEDRAALPAGVVDAYPATLLQLGMILHTDTDPAQGVFHDLIRYRVDLPFDREILTGLLTGLVDAHEILRTSFALTGYSEPLQLVHAHGQTHLTVHDLEHLAPAARRAAIDAWFEAEKSTGFLWEAPTQMRFFVHRATADSFHLSVSFHHAIIDGWSFSGLMARLLEDYRRLVAGEERTAAAPAPLAYRDYVRLELQARQDTAAEAYWTGLLDGAPYTKLPRSPEAGARWAEAGLLLDEERYAGLARLAERHRVSVKDVCLAAHFRALSLITGEEDVTTGVFGHGRPEHLDADRMVGLFLNIVPLRVRSGGDWPALLASVNRIGHEHLPHRRFPYASIQRATGGRRLVETAFNFVNFSAYAEQLGSDGAGVIGELKWFEHADFALLVTFNADLFTRRMRLNFNAAASVLGETAVRTVAEVYEAVIDGLLGDPAAGDRIAPLLARLPRPADGRPDDYDRAGAPAPGRIAGLDGVDPAELDRLIERICGEEAGNPHPDSLTSLRLAAALRDTFGVHVPLARLLTGGLAVLGR
ncbi:amino acid adenylation domain-containing protein [Streptomyces sp. LP05-1]|uniref:Amino acid adenylation domain-containing protein n=1 Tax=Streptomyces pyxinae TaxID=2970734 RepID=A0ABT2CEB0_9ACTN|nr:non-ribosomal peptide synthetase [Streptomyces sp. LP05-1]MCS0635755.1 amino acid adenylation domain-containing protein [Streptomyces sp. LP05-1]